MKAPAIAFPSTVTVEAYQGDTAYGPTYAPGATHRGQAQGRRRQVTTADGRDVIARATIILRGAVDVPADSKVTVDGTTYRAVETVEHRTPLGRQTATEVICA